MVRMRVMELGRVGGLQLHDFAKREIPGITRIFVDKLQVDVFSKKNFFKAEKTIILSSMVTIL